MRLDHISYVTSHSQLADTVQRLGSRLGTTFVDGGVHPRFGTRNFTMPLLNGQYLEVVCPLDHPATETSPLGKAVSRRASEGGGWMGWVISADEFDDIESRLGRNAVDGHRVRPDGSDLRWKQIGVLDTLEDPQLPFFVKWLTTDHPSKDGNPVAEILRIEIQGNENTFEKWTGAHYSKILAGIKMDWISPSNKENKTGITGIYFKTQRGEIRLD